MYFVYVVIDVVDGIENTLERLNVYTFCIHDIQVLLYYCNLILTIHGQVYAITSLV